MELLEIHSILISDVTVSTNDMGIGWDFTKHITFPHQMLVCVDDDDEWELHGTVLEGPGIIWKWYGADPYHSHTRYSGESMELCQILGNPIVKDNRIKTE